MKFSIIVPVFNSFNMLNNLLDSVNEQSYENWELIFVDDGSTDDSLKKLEELKKDNNKIQVYSQTNSGPGIARKNGLNKSTGDLCIFIDSDDWISTNSFLDDVNKIFINNNIDVLVFDREEQNENEKKVIKSFKSLKSGIHNLEEINEKIRPGLGNKVFKKTLLSEDLFIDSKIFEDLYTTYLYFDKCQYFYYVEKVYYTINRRPNENSLSMLINQKNPMYFEKVLEIVADVYKKLDKECLKKSLAYYAQGHYYTFVIKKIKRNKSFYKNEKILKNIEELIFIMHDSEIGFDKTDKRLIDKIIYNFSLKKKIRRCLNEKSRNH